MKSEIPKSYEDLISSLQAGKIYTFDIPIESKKYFMPCIKRINKLEIILRNKDLFNYAKAMIYGLYCELLSTIITRKRQKHV